MRPATALVLSAFVLVTLGVSKNPIFLRLSAVPLLYLALGILIPKPDGVSVERAVERRDVRVGGEVKVRLRIRVRKGVGFVVLRENLPPELRPTGGSTSAVLFKGRGELRAEIEYTTRVLKRGLHRIPPAEVYSEHLLGLEKASLAFLGGETVIKGLPSVVKRRRVRLPMERSKFPVPPTTYSLIGSRSTDFSEVREYLPGDPLKFINWKATARRGKPLVNEFEREGKRSVFIYIDTGMEDFALESSIALAASLVEYLTWKNFSVGIYLVGTGRFTTPTTETKAHIRLLSFERTFERREDFETAVRRSRRILVQYTPFVLYFTSVSERNLGEIKEGKKALRKYLGGRSPLILDVFQYSGVDEGLRGLLSLRRLALRQRLGGGVLAWDPEREPTGKALSRLVAQMRA